MLIGDDSANEEPELGGDDGGDWGTSSCAWPMGEMRALPPTTTASRTCPCGTSRTAARSIWHRPIAMGIGRSCTCSAGIKSPMLAVTAMMMTPRFLRWPKRVVTMSSLQPVLVAVAIRHRSHRLSHHPWSSVPSTPSTRRAIVSHRCSRDVIVREVIVVA